MEFSVFKMAKKLTNWRGQPGFMTKKTHVKNVIWCDIWHQNKVIPSLSNLISKAFPILPSFTTHLRHYLPKREKVWFPASVSPARSSQYTTAPPTHTHTHKNHTFLPGNPEPPTIPRNSQQINEIVPNTDRASMVKGNDVPVCQDTCKI